MPIPREIDASGVTKNSQRLRLFVIAFLGDFAIVCTLGFAHITDSHITLCFSLMD
jgi:hypothetical protein